MRSSGGLAPMPEAKRSGAWSVLSGPAGGAVGAALLARLSGSGKAIGLDMGGTSCDVCVIEDGEVRRTASREIDGRPIQLPMVDVHTVGAGGGSIGWVDHGGALRVGPRSAGADPGPACYGRGGRDATMTDANLALGYLDAGSSLAGGVRLDLSAAREALRDLGERAGLDELDDGMGNHPGCQPGDGSRDQGGHGGARHRSTGVCAHAIWRRGPDACGGPRRRARHQPDPLPPCERRALGAGAGCVGAPPRHGTDGDAERRRAHGGPPGPGGRRPSRRHRRGARGRARRSGIRPALPRPGVRADDPRIDHAIARGSDRGLRGRARAPLRTPRRGRRRRARQCPPGPRRPRPGDLPGCRRRDRAWAKHPPRSLRRRVAGRRDPARGAAGRARGPGPMRLRASRGDARAPRGWHASVDAQGTIVAEVEGNS